MKVKTPVLLLLFFVMVTASVQAQPHGQEKQEPLADVRSQLFKQVLADFRELRECLEQEEGGVRAAQQNMSVARRKSRWRT